jgi:hypothetical protein
LKHSRRKNMLDQSFNLSDSNVLNDVFQLPTLAGESGLGRSDMITPILPKAVKGMDSSLFSSSVEEYRQGLENGWQSSQSLSSWRNGGDFLTGQSLAGSLSSSVDRAGNTLATARAITVGSTATSYTDWVGSTDTNDFYRFSLSNTSNFNLGLTGLTADADVRLLDGNGNTIVSSTRSGTASESISRQLNAGTYYIRVFPYSGSTNYNLAVSAVPLAPVDNAGNTLATARAITVGSTATSYTDWVGSTDTNDFYRFSLSNTSNFNLGLTGLTADADVRLLDSNGNTIVSSTRSGTASESISRQLNAGTYYIRVFPYSGSTNYNLAVSAVPLAPVDNAGNTLATARAITVGSTATSYTDWVGSTDTNDFYRFSLSNTSNFNLGLTGLTADADVRLLDSNGNTIVSSTQGGTTSESISRQLNAGNYYIQVFPYSGSTNYNLSVSATASGGGGSDWFSQNLRDAGLISTVRSLGTDGNLSRNDMISVLRNAQDGGVIDATEITDLRTVITNASRFTMQDHVRVISNKVVNGDAANQWWTGGATTRTTLGNLYAGSSANQMELLISKWFLGSDRPNPISTGDSAQGNQQIGPLTYRSINGSLFQNGISANDIFQGAAGTCYYMATLSSIAQEKPSYIQNMFIDNGDNTFTVRFFRNGVADYVTVDRFLPTNTSGQLVYASPGSAFNNSANELWVALAEKAYAQLAESGWSRPGKQESSYRSIDGGWMDDATRHLTGLSAYRGYVNNISPTQLVSLVNSNQILTVGFIHGDGYGVHNQHAYTITSYNSSTGTFALRNPWGRQHANLTWQQLANLRAVIAGSNT